MGRRLKDWKKAASFTDFAVYGLLEIHVGKKFSRPATFPILQIIAIVVEIECKNSRIFRNVFIIIEIKLWETVHILFVRKFEVSKEPCSILNQAIKFVEKKN